MGDNVGVEVRIPLDDSGMLGRKCLLCKRYFKLKPGTGIPDNRHCHCPYCEYAGDQNTFWTPAQIEYAQTVGLNHIVENYIQPAFNDLTKAFEELEKNSRHGLIKISISTSGNKIHFPVKYYLEHDVETTLTCDHCGLVFSVYGVFGRCPDCSELNAFLMFEKSIEVLEKQVDIFSNPEIPNELLQQCLGSVLTGAVAAFDGLGKELRKRKPYLYPAKPTNLFQNLSVLNTGLNNLIAQNHSDYQYLNRFFLIRHLIEHTMGVVDDDFVKKLPAYSHLLGRKAALEISEIRRFISLMSELGSLIKEHFKKGKNA